MGAQIWQHFQKGDSRQVKSKVPQIWQLFIFRGGGWVGVVGVGGVFWARQIQSPSNLTTFHWGGGGYFGKVKSKVPQIWQLFIFGGRGGGVVGWGVLGVFWAKQIQSPSNLTTFHWEGGILGKSNPKSLKSDNLTIFSLGGEGDSREHRVNWDFWTQIYPTGACHCITDSQGGHILAKMKFPVISLCYKNFPFLVLFLCKN